ncbi:MAG TPA: OmpA family protein [Arenimonas sp.]|nr:OmpA family protein [Arenimonas sp.]
MHIRRRPVLLFALLGGLAVTAPLHAQSLAERLGRTIERAAESEVHRQVDRRTREVTRCALGDERCIRDAERRGDEVEVVGSDARRNRGRTASADPGGDHPLIVPYAGSRLCAREFSAYDEATRVSGNVKGVNTTQTHEGRYTRLCYRNPEGRSAFEVMRNYRDALVARGMEVEYQCKGNRACASFNVSNGPALGDVMRVKHHQVSNQSDLRYFTGRLARPDGVAYVSVAVIPEFTLIHVLESDQMDTGMVSVNAGALAAGLERDGKVTLEGIYFDTGRASLRPESDPAIAQVALLMREQPGLNLMVVGHTDSSGDHAVNMRLSQQRAERVRDALVARHGVAAARLTAQGVGAALPVASNDTASGRQQNRRVELVKR